MLKQKLLIVLLVLCAVFGMNAQFTVQGIPYDNPKFKGFDSAKMTAAAETSAFTFDMIENWTGEGANRAAMVVQWNDDRETKALVFGYKWDGEATSCDMIEAIAAANPRFYTILQKGTQYGTAVGGFGWDADDAGEIRLFKGEKAIMEVTPGVFDGDSYGFDGITPLDSNDYWFSGWNDGFWSFWVKDSAAGEFGFASVGASTRKLVDGCWDGWNYSPGMQSLPWKPFEAAPANGSDYTKGYFILNEDWFGHDDGSINYVDENDVVSYRVFRANNEGCKLGVTSAHASIYGGKMFVVSKQNDASVKAGGRLVVLDAKTMKLIASVNELGEVHNDGRTFIGVSDKLGYIGTTEGVYTFDTENYVTGNLVAGTNVEIGDMCRYQNYIFATGRGKGVFVIDAKTNELVQTVDIPKITTVFVTYAGGLYAASSGNGTSGFYKIDPYTFTTEFFAVADGASVAEPWFAWQPGKVSSVKDENVIYFGAGGWSVSTLSRYNFDTKTLDQNIVKFTSGHSVYGAVETNPVTGEIITTTNKGWGANAEHNMIQVIDPKQVSVDAVENEIGKNVAKAITLEKYYWFPSMPVFQDNEAPVVSGLENIKLDIDFDQTFNTPLLDLVSDADNFDVSIAAEIKNIQGEQFMNAKLENGNLVINPVDDGEASFDFVVNSNGKYVTKHVVVSVIRSTGVDEVFATQSDIVYNNGNLKINANTDGMVEVYNLSGQVMMTAEVAEGCNVYSLAELANGVYVVKFNNVARKIVK